MKPTTQLETLLAFVSDDTLNQLVQEIGTSIANIHSGDAWHVHLCDLQDSLNQERYDRAHPAYDGRDERNQLGITAG